MSYIIRKSDGTVLTTIQDGLVDQEVSSLSIIGKNVSGFGQYQNDNYLWLMEHFAFTQEPRSSMTGQIWFNSNPGVMRPFVNDGDSWRPLGVTLYSNTTTDTTSNVNGMPFTASQPGDFWYKSDDRQLYINTTATGYQLIGPERVPGFLETKMRSTKIYDISGVGHPVIETLIDGELVSIMSKKTFATTSSVAAIGFPNVYRGITFKNYDPAHRYETTSTDVTLHGINSFLDESYPRRDQAETIPSTWGFTNGLSIGINPSTLINDGNSNLSIASNGGNISLFVNGSTGVAGIYQEGIIPANNVRQNLGNSNAIWNNAYIQNLTAGGASSGATLQGSWALTNNSKLLPFADLGNDLGLSTQRFNNIYAGTINSGNQMGSIAGDWKFGQASQILPFVDLGNSLGSQNLRFNTVFTQNISAGEGLPATLTGEFTVKGDIVPFEDNLYNLGGPGQRWASIRVADAMLDEANIDMLTANIMTLTDMQGITIDCFDPDGTLAANDDKCLSTQKAVKTYVDNTKADLLALIEALQRQLGDAISNIRVTPAGVIEHFAGSTAPAGYLVCDGRTLITTSYPDLFNAIGYTYGGSGTSFAIPNLLGEFIRGWDAGRGVDAGRNLGSSQAADISSHSHYFNDVWLIQSDASNPITGSRNLDGSYGYPARNVDGQAEPEAGYGAYVQPINDTSYNDGGTNDNCIWTIRNRTEVAGGGEIRPRNVALLPIIKFRNGS